MKSKFIYAILVVATLMPANLFAQQKKQKGTLTDTIIAISEVTVEAERKKMNVAKLDVPAKYLPLSTNSIDVKTLEARGITDISTAFQFLPSVKVNTSYGAFKTISIRGFSNQLIMVDGVRDERSSIDNSYPFMDLTAVESIELLKGPSSVLYGQSAVGGVINIVRKAPTEKQTFSARIGYGSWTNLQTTATLGGKLIGKLNYIGSFNYQRTDGWRDNTTSNLSGYLAIGGDLTARDRLDIRISGNHDYYDTEIGLPPTVSYDVYSASTDKLFLAAGEMNPFIPNNKARYNSESDFMYNRGTSTSISYKHTFNEKFALSDRFSYTYDDIDYFSTEELSYLTSTSAIYDYYYTTSSGSKRYICLDSIYYSYPLRFSHEAKTSNNQLEANGKFNIGGVKNTYLAGWSYINMHRVSWSGYEFGYGEEDEDVVGPGLTGHGSVSNPHSIGWMDTKFSYVTPQVRTQHGIYVQDLLELSDAWKVMVALRYDTYKYRRKSSLEAIGGKRHYEDVDKSEYNKITTSALTYRVGAVYEPVENLQLYASYGTYFKPIYTFYSANYIYVDKNGNEYNPEDGGEVFKPERGGQIEVGARYELNNKLQANASIYYINKNNIRTLLASKGDVVDGVELTKAVYGQVGRMDSRGFDIDLTYRPIYGMQITAGYGFTNAKVRELADNKYLSSDSSKGKQYSNIPRNTLYAYGDYTVQRGTLQGLGILFSLAYHDKVFRNSSNTTQFDAYWMTDLGLSYKLKNNIRLSLNVNNLFNVDYIDQSVGNQYVPGTPRNFLASVAYTL